CDGLQYHHDRVADDVIKRSALLLSGKYWVYTLNWDDLPPPGEQPKVHDPDLLIAPGPEQATMRRLYSGIADSSGWRSAAECETTNKQDSLSRLQAVLRDPAQVETGALQVSV